MGKRMRAWVGLATIVGLSVGAWVGNAWAQSCERSCAAEKRDAYGCCPSAPAPHPPSVAPPAARPVTPAAAAPACPNGTARLPAGSFQMGSRSDTVTVDAFCMDVTEVTVQAYTACVTANGCTEPGRYVAGSTNWVDRACNWQRPGGALHPVNCVDWSQASSYCAWSQKRLPTEEEWEWAARSGPLARVYPWGNDAPTAARVNARGTEGVAWGKANGVDGWVPLYGADDGWGTTAPVGAFPRGATAQGIQDMAGNVWEWTSSSFDASTRVRRGGSWFTNDASGLRAMFRIGDDPAKRPADMGFRCAR